MKIGFALITDRPFLDQIVGLEHSFHERAGFSDRLGLEVNLPHITVFQGDFVSETDYRAVADSLAEDFRRLFPERCVSFQGIRYVSKGWYFLVCDRTASFEGLHGNLLGLVRPFLNVAPFSAADCEDDLTSEQEQGIIDYGYRYSGPAFYPHITIGRSEGLDSGLLADMNENLSGLPSRAVISRITVYRMGNNGTHSETLYEINL